MEIFLCIALIILNIIDVITTYKILSMGGYEVNPISRLLIKLHLFVPFKAAATLCFVWIVLIPKPPVSFYLAVFCTLFYVLIVGNNLYQIHNELKWLRENES